MTVSNLDTHRKSPWRPHTRGSIKSETVDRLLRIYYCISEY